jgi:hypothetical protein
MSVARTLHAKPMNKESIDYDSDFLLVDSPDQTPTSSIPVTKNVYKIF